MTIQEIIEKLEKVTFSPICVKFMGVKNCQECKNNYPGKSCHSALTTRTAKLLKEALDEQTLKDAEGVPIHDKDIVWQTKPYDGTNYEKFTVINGNYDGLVATYSDEFGFAYVNPEHLTHNEPDSWAKLEREARKGGCEYFCGNDISCASCPALDCPETCETAFVLDVLRRAKALANKG